MGEVCPNRDKLVGGGCRFEPRYDRKPPTPETINAAREALGSVFDDVFGGVGIDMEDLTTDVYVLDICTRCGKVVKREAST